MARYNKVNDIISINIWSRPSDRKPVFITKPDMASAKSICILGVQPLSNYFK
jgi:hypothetical protein